MRNSISNNGRTFFPPSNNVYHCIQRKCPILISLLLRPKNLRIFVPIKKTLEKPVADWIKLVCSEFEKNFHQYGSYNQTVS